MRCPFCKTANYAVEYRGVKTKEEKGMEQIVRLVAHGHSQLDSLLKLWNAWLTYIRF